MLHNVARYCMVLRLCGANLVALHHGLKHRNLRIKDMATVTAFIRTTQKKTDKVNIRFRLRDGRNKQLFHKSEITVNPDLWDAKKQEIKAKSLCRPEIRAQILNGVQARKRLMLELYDALIDKSISTSEWLEVSIDQSLNPGKCGSATTRTFFNVFDEFLEKHKVSEIRKRGLRVIKRSLMRFELFKQKSSVDYIMTFENLTADILREIDEFFRKEYLYVKTYPDIYEQIKDSRISLPRGQNTISGMFARIRTFILWAIREGKTTNNPFLRFKIEEAIYGTPYYIDIEERNKLYSIDFSDKPNLAIQRDIFVFQCLIGCRIGDLMRLTRGNLINEAIEYIPAKTKEGRPKVVRVPLNTTAKEILARYPDCAKLLPFISEQKYNVAIKEMFTLAGLMRMVTVINPTTRKEEQRPINEIASSHLARRCFIGNLYKKVKDPNLIGSMSGHVEGSKAFARYRDIDDDIKRELVDLLE